MAPAVALPEETPTVAWDPDRGVYLIRPDNPEWAAVRAAYERQLAAPRPIVATPRRRLRDRLRGLRRQLALAADAFLGRRR